MANGQESTIQCGVGEKGMEGRPEIPRKDLLYCDGSANDYARRAKIKAATKFLDEWMISPAQLSLMQKWILRIWFKPSLHRWNSACTPTRQNIRVRWELQRTAWSGRSGQFRNSGFHKYRAKIFTRHRVWRRSDLVHPTSYEVRLQAFMKVRWLS